MFDNKNLNEDLRDFFQDLIRRLAPGIYRLAEMLGNDWSLLEPKTAIGIWFRCAVDAGEFPGVRTCGKTVENHQLYSVNKEAV